jgi:hypothetical protein
MKKENQVILGAISVTAFFILAIIAKNIFNKKNNRKNNDMITLSAGAIAAIKITVKVVGTAVVILGISGGIVYHQHLKQKIEQIDKNDYSKTLSDIESSIFIDIENLGKAHHNIQKNRKVVFDNTLEIINLERRHVEFYLKLIQENKKDKKDIKDKIIDAIDFLDWIKSKETKLREAASETSRNDDIIKRNNEMITEIVTEIAKFRKCIEGAKKEIQKDLEYMEKLHKNINSLINLYKERRSKMIKDGFLPNNTPEFQYQTQNRQELYNTTAKMIKECKDDNGKLSSEIACATATYVEALVNMKREYSKVKERKEIEQILQEEADIIDEERRKVQFPSFYQVINTNKLPSDYSPNQNALLHSKEDLKKSIEYLESETRVFNNVKRTQKALRGEIDVFYESRYAISKNIKQIQFVEEKEDYPSANIDNANFTQYRNFGIT